MNESENPRQPESGEIDPETAKKWKGAFDFVLQDMPSEPVDAVFLHPLSFGDDDEMFPLAARYIKEGKAKYIVINGSNGEALNDPTPGKAWAGKDEYISKLTKSGVDQNSIILAAPAFHTRQNNDVFLQTAKEHGWKTAATLNQPQQLLRATLGQIKAMEEQNYWMRLYSLFPEPWEAARKVYGSQGAGEQRRYSLLPADIERIIKYQKQGDLAGFDEFSDYIKRRPNIT